MVLCTLSFFFKRTRVLGSCTRSCDSYPCHSRLPPGQSPIGRKVFNRTLVVAGRPGDRSSLVGYCLPKIDRPHAVNRRRQPTSTFVSSGESETSSSQVQEEPQRASWHQPEETK